MKFCYLDGQAALALEGLPLTEGNYQSAVNILHGRFGKKQKIISKHMDALLNIPPCKNDIQLHYVYDIHVRGLEALGINSEQYGSLLIPVIMSRVPNEIALLIARHTQQDVWSTPEILATIKRDVEAREMRDQMKTVDASKEPKKDPGKVKHGNTSSLYAKGEIQKGQCFYCNGNHATPNCMKVKDVATRKSLLRKNYCCFICLRKGHIARCCQQFKRCKHCQGKHHHTICEKSTENTETQTENTSITATSTGHKEATNVLLQTAQATVLNPENGKRATDRILLDSGSQRSYISEDIQQKLGLESEGKQRLNLNTFGDTKFQRKDCDLVSLQLQTSCLDFWINVPGHMFSYTH